MRGRILRRRERWRPGVFSGGTRGGRSGPCWRGAWGSRWLGSGAGSSPEDAVTFRLLLAQGVDHPFDLERMLPHGEEGLAEENGVADHAIEEVFEVSLDDGEGVLELDSDVSGEGGWGSALGLGAFIAEGDPDETSGFAEPDGNEGDLEVAVVAPCVTGEAEGDAEDGGFA